jgi:hypothetical protein
MGGLTRLLAHVAHAANSAGRHVLPLFRRQVPDTEHRKRDREPQPTAYRQGMHDCLHTMSVTTRLSVSGVIPLFEETRSAPVGGR